MTKFASIFCAIALAAGATLASAQEGSISGTVTFDGTPKKPKKLNKDLDGDKFCGPARADQDVYSDEIVVDATTKAVANTLVYIKNKPSGKFAPPEKPEAIDQVKCIYVPHVVVVQVGQTLQIKNSDDTAHNIHSKPEFNKEFNKGQAKAGEVEEVKFTVPEMGIKVKCDVHGWMNAWLHVMDHPFYSLTGKDGKFSIKNLPKGTYTVEVWHEKFKGKAVEVTVGDKEAKEQNFTLKAE